MYIRFLIIFFIGLSSSIVHAGLLPDTTIQHETISHFVADTRLVLDAQLNDTKGINEARCYFKTGSDRKYLYVSMSHLSGNGYRCFLPAFIIGSNTLEYFFLIVNGRNQVIRSTPYVVEEVNDNVDPQEQATEVSTTILYVFSELGDVGKGDTGIVDDQINLAPTQDLNQLYGLRGGVYEPTVIPESLNCISGYFGGFILEKVHNTLRPVKGFAPNIKQSFFTTSFPASMLQKSTDIQLKDSEVPDISGANWAGCFIDGVTSVRENLTASIVLTGSQVTIETTRTDLGHHFTGTINSNGDMLLYDSYDGEDWTTHFGPATATKIDIYDFVRPPSVDDPSPPLNEIVLYRVSMSPILHLLL